MNRIVQLSSLLLTLVACEGQVVAFLAEKGGDAQSSTGGGEGESVAPDPDGDASAWDPTWVASPDASVAAWDATLDVSEPRDAKEASSFTPICGAIEGLSTWSQVMDMGSRCQYHNDYELRAGCGYGVAVSGSRDASVTVYYDLDSGLFVGGEYFSVALGLDCKVGVVPEGGLAGVTASWIQMVDGCGATEGGDTQ